MTAKNGVQGNMPCPPAAKTMVFPACPLCYIGVWRVDDVVKRQIRMIPQ
jgi:hypothetical protein